MTDLARQQLMTILQDFILNSGWEEGDELYDWAMHYADNGFADGYVEKENTSPAEQTEIKTKEKTLQSQEPIEESVLPSTQKEPHRKNIVLSSKEREQAFKKIFEEAGYPPIIKPKPKLTKAQKSSIEKINLKSWDKFK